MNPNDWKRLLLGPTLFRLDTIISTRLVPILYAIGLLAVLVWAINHLFFMFATGIANGLWGLVEIAVFGLLALVLLRIACEVLLVFFKAHEAETESVSRSRIGSTLMEDVNEALHDLAEADEDEITIREPVHTPPSPRPMPPAPRPSTEVVASPMDPAKRPPVRRTAKRTPKPRTEPGSEP